MQILVISDSHGKNDDVKRVLDQVGTIDMLIHLGDVERNTDYIREMAKCETHIVLGNNDFFMDLPQQESIEIAGKQILLTHGHRFYVNYGVDKLREYALENGYDIAMFGHTHRPYLEIGEKVTILNPGSISFPRQEERKCTYTLIDVDREGEFHYSQGVIKSSKAIFYQEFFK